MYVHEPSLVQLKKDLAAFVVETQGNDSRAQPDSRAQVLREVERFVFCDSMKRAATSRRTDEASHHLEFMLSRFKGIMSQYKSAGVDIDAGNRAVALMKDAVRSTYTPNVLADIGSFGGLFALSNLPANPVLVASTDGVGTKVKLAAELGRWAGIGHDIVNHCTNDILVQNARPLFFLDYVATSNQFPRQWQPWLRHCRSLQSSGLCAVGWRNCRNARRLCRRCL